jgi:CheY-like chemotaxis protein
MEIWTVWHPDYRLAGALQAARADRPDAVILDIGMPDMNGYAVARAMREQDWGSRLFLIAVTGWGQATDKEQARAAGFDLHLTKPVAPEAIEAALEQVRRI